MIPDRLKAAAQAAHNVNPVAVPVQDEEEIEPCLEEYLDEEFHLVAADEIEGDLHGGGDCRQDDEEFRSDRHDADCAGLRIVDIGACKWLEEVIPFAVLVRSDVHPVLERCLICTAEAPAERTHEHRAEVERKPDAEDDVPCGLVGRLDVEGNHDARECDHDGRYDPSDGKHAVRHGSEVVLEGVVAAL